MLEVYCVNPGQGVNENSQVVPLKPDGSARGTIIIPTPPVYTDPKTAHGAP